MFLAKSLVSAIRAIKKPVKLAQGTRVKVVSFNKNGVFQSVKGDKVTVVIDDMRMVVNKNDLAGIN